MAKKPAKILYRIIAPIAKHLSTLRAILLLIFFRGDAFCRCGAVFPAGRLLKPAHYCVVILLKVRPYAPGAVLDALLGEGKAAPAFVSQKIQRTVAEKAVEIVRIRALVAGEKLALRVIYELIFFS